MNKNDNQGLYINFDIKGVYVINNFVIKQKGLLFFQYEIMDSLKEILTCDKYYKPEIYKIFDNVNIIYFSFKEKTTSIKRFYSKEAKKNINFKNISGYRFHVKIIGYLKPETAIRYYQDNIIIKSNNVFERLIERKINRIVYPENFLDIQSKVNRVYLN